MIKPTMTDAKKARIYQSVQFMAVMAEMIKIEHMTDLVDAYFKNPVINQFAKRIAEDSKSIQANLKRNEKVMVAFQDLEFIEEYASELWRLFHFFIGLPVSQIRDVMDGLTNAKIQLEENNEKSSELFQVIYDTIDCSFTGADVEGKDRAYAIQNASEVLCDLVKHSISKSSEVTI